MNDPRSDNAKTGRLFLSDMTEDDLVRKHIERLLRDVREQHDHALSTLADALVQLVQTGTAEVRQRVEAELNAQAQKRVEALQMAAMARIAEAEAGAAATVAAIREEAAAELRRVQEEADGRAAASVDAAHREAAAQLRRVQEEADGRAAASVDAARREAAAELRRVQEESATRAAAAVSSAREEAAAELRQAQDEIERRVAAVKARLAEVEKERDTRVHAAETKINEVESDRAKRIADLLARLAEAERERDTRVAASEAAAAAATEQTEARALEREADLERFERLLVAIREIDGGRTLTDTLDALLVHAAHEAARVAILLVRGDRFEGWRATGFDAPPTAMNLAAPEAGIIARAARTGRRAATSDASRREHGVDGPPSFVSLPADRVGLAVPLSIGGHIVGVIYADDVSEVAREVPSGWPEGIEILVRHAARSLEALTALKAAPLLQRAANSAPIQTSRAESDDESAKRYAKLLVQEIKLYHQPEVEAGRRARDLAARLGPQIARARSLFEERIGGEGGSRMNFFDQELVKTLADGDPMLLGARPSGSPS